jgi:5-methylcytosine-specific restriction protein B
MDNKFEVNARKAKIDQLFKAQSTNHDRMTRISELDALRREQDKTGNQIREDFQKSLDLETFRSQLDAWGRQEGYLSFSGMSGQMFLNQLISYSTEPEKLVGQLAKWLSIPKSTSEAAKSINELAAYAASIKQGGRPAPRRSIYFLSFFWSLQNHNEWPCFWASAEKSLVQLGWLENTDDYGELYLNFREIIRAAGPSVEVEHVLRYLSDEKFLGIDPSISQRCKLNCELGAQRVDSKYPDAESMLQAGSNARSILGELQMLGDVLADRMSNSLDQPIKVETPSVYWADTCYRGDGWVRWRLNDGSGKSAISIRVWVTIEGTFVGIHPGLYRIGWLTEAAPIIRKFAPATAIAMPVKLGKSRITPAPDEAWQGEIILGWKLTSSLSDPKGICEEVLARATELRPVLEQLIELSKNTALIPIDLPELPLQTLVNEYISARGYPTKRDKEDLNHRAEMAAVLAKDQILTIDIKELRRIYGTARYGSPGPQSVLHTTLNSAIPTEIDEYLTRIKFLLWGEGNVADRIDELLDVNKKWIKGLGESSIMKFLSIVSPERFVPIFPYTGDNGKLKLMKALQLEPPPDNLSPGHRQVAANDSIRKLLEPYFPNDPWAQAQFAYWLDKRERWNVDPEPDRLAALADDLLVSRNFISEIVERLRNKGQLVFYGPPGTGKTYVARLLAEALVASPKYRAIVQFHPSTSYEDFFEGYRPEEKDGQLIYRLQKGPLARLAESAEENPEIEHILIIDELNRANLPKVFGELLYLLEYRDEPIQTLYRPDEPFELPKNLLIIGTMNTADRSVALVDAALRRRFHFIPFFPNDGEMTGLLSRWLAQNKQPSWVADFVDFVNEKLTIELGGPDLQLGPSYFIQKNVVSDLPRIWKYNIEPLLQDQLFGQEEKIQSFTYTNLMNEFRPTIELQQPAVSD